LSSFWLILKQQWTIEEIYILVTVAILNGGWGCRTQIWKGTTKGPSQPNLFLIWFSGFRGEDLNVFFYQNMPNLHNRLKEIWAHFDLYWSSNGQLKKFLFLVTAAILNGGQGCRTQFWKEPTQGPSLPGLV
jgi:hypothetical protein